MYIINKKDSMNRILLSVIICIAGYTSLQAMEEPQTETSIYENTFLCVLSQDVRNELEMFKTEFSQKVRDVVKAILEHEKKISMRGLEDIGFIFQSHVAPIIKKHPFFNNPSVTLAFLNAVFAQLLPKTEFKDVLPELVNRMRIVLYTMYYFVGEKQTVTLLKEIFRCDPVSKVIAGRLLADLYITATPSRDPETDEKEIDMLLQAGVDVNATNEQGNTALMTAADNNEPSLVKFLLMRGANPHIKNKAGKTALEIVREKYARVAAHKKPAKDAQKVSELLEQALKNLSR